MLTVLALAGCGIAPEEDVAAALEGTTWLCKQTRAHFVVAFKEGNVCTYAFVESGNTYDDYYVIEAGKKKIVTETLVFDYVYDKETQTITEIKAEDFIFRKM